MEATRFLTKPGGYVLDVCTLVDQQFIAVFGIRTGDGSKSLAQDILRRAAQVVLRDVGSEFGTAILLYLAQIGRPLGGGEHIKWPPVDHGLIERDRRRWRRPYLSWSTRQDLNRRVLPEAVAAVFGEKDSGLTKALELFRPGPLLRGEDERLHHIAWWRPESFAYPATDDDERLAIQRELVSLARRWARAPRAFLLSDELSGWIERKALRRDGKALGCLLGLLRDGHRITHESIRRHQHSALGELGTLVSAWEELLAEASGLHELLYAPFALFGYESWQFTRGQSERLRITLPEIVGLGRDAMGRRAWLEPLMAACAKRDVPAQRRHLDSLRQYLALLGANVMTDGSPLHRSDREVAWPTNPDTGGLQDLPCIDPDTGDPTILAPNPVEILESAEAASHAAEALDAIMAASRPKTIQKLDAVQHHLRAGCDLVEAKKRAAEDLGVKVDAINRAFSRAAKRHRPT